MADQQRPHRDPWDSYDEVPFLRNPVVLAMGALFLGLASIVLFLLLTGDNQETVNNAEQLVVTADESTTTTSTTPGVDSSETAAEGSVIPANPAGPYVEATLQEKDFVLRGVVPTAALASSYLQAVEIAYAPFVTSELMVDEDLEPVEWLAKGPEAIVLLPIITDGTIRIAEDQVALSGRSPSEERVQKLDGALTQTLGLPVTVGDMAITGLATPNLNMVAGGGSVELTGVLPSDELRQSLVSGAEAAYGSGQVVDNTDVDPGVFTALWMYSSESLLQAMSVFPEYQLQIDGTEFSGFINGGVTFEPNSAVFSGDYAQVLDVGVAVLTRDQSLQLVIEGHTDSDGPADFNLALSQRRAEEVMQYFIDNGIAPERLTAVGKGETEPAAPNDTAEGRARNRRIQYVLTSAQ